MIASFTCSDPERNNHLIYTQHPNSRPPLKLQTSAVTPSPATTAGHGQTSQADTKPITLAVSPKVLSNQSDMHTKTTVNIAEITVGADFSPAGSPIQPSSPVMKIGSDTRSNRPTLATPPPSRPNSRRTPKRKRTVSPPSPSPTSKVSAAHRRSASRHTTTHRSAPASRRSSFQSHRPNVSLTPSMSGQGDLEFHREDLLALHRESCRLFQDGVSRPSPPSTTPHTPPQTVRASSEMGSPPLSPTLSTYISTSSRGHDSIMHGVVRPGPPRTHSVPVTTYDPDVLAPIQPSPTVIDWTSPSTRRREYEKIDRASTGVRGFWRRVAPRWCQFGHSRVPFFEEGKDGKANYEGSVRRIRMDLPDEPGEHKRGAMRVKLRRRFTTTGMNGS
ncbi:hypothetical protein FE257_013084 [Aspergillus nanangensis]|uniref:Uncharacterized protein n=1 Tax=Aspergillus nanangensis TaxID=2582783 RepID=A0AAD4CEZ8_ASPNN|nr:hypothetical protein FE257_013084 [Aspergillus nanangensis]